MIWLPARLYLLSKAAQAAVRRDDDGEVGAGVPKRRLQ
jgi:hypothetical protein